jgi:phosphatidylserine/phosphatidylglycerophosphate/cardiolipin synthase-like enzyme
MKARWPRIAGVGLLAAWIGVAGWQAAKPLPQGVHVASPICRASADQVAFIADITAADAFGRAAVSQGIFDAVLEVVRGARHFIVLDYSGFDADATDAAAAGAAPQRHIAAELTDALLERRRTQPDLAVLFITDPANERYGAARSVELQLLRAAGVEVVLTELDRLRDSNLAYSSLWRLALRWWDPPSGPLGVESRRLNFKADGRRLIIADDGRGGLTAVIGSATPRDSESLWSNVAVRLGGGALVTLLKSELAVARFSGWAGRSEPFLAVQAAPAPAPSDCAAAAGAAAGSSAELSGSDARVQLLTEGATREGLLARLDATGRGESIDVAMFHLAERAVVESLLAAARRGVSVRVILDPDAAAPSGTAASIPNQPVASELVARSAGAIRLRWYRTHGERFHDSLVMIYGPRRLWLTLGSAQLTRRSLSDYNLEANVALEVARNSVLAQQALEYFDTLWGNRAALGIEYSADFAVFADPAQSDYWLGRLMEGTGLSAF